MIKKVKNKLVKSVNVEQGMIVDFLSDEEQVNKELTIANIKLSILTMWQYVNSKKVVLPSDVKTSKKGTPAAVKDKCPTKVEGQLEAIKAHIEDLQVSSNCRISVLGSP